MEHINDPDDAGWIGYRRLIMPTLGMPDPFAPTEHISDHYTLLPHVEGFNPEDLCFTDVIDFIPYYEICEDRMNIDDTVWGREVLGNTQGDVILLQLAKSEPFRRLMSVEQLTLDAKASTIPNTATFSRWEHVWGSVVLTRKLLRQQGIDPTSREAVVLQLRTLISDVGHTAFSHMGDWLFQGKQGGEDLHDKKLKRFVERTGLGDLLRGQGFEVDEVVFPKVRDFVENKAPAVNIDRLDYVYRERRRWPGAHMIQRPNIDRMKISAIDGEITFTDEEAALEFGRAAAVLPVMHWQEPVHRLMEEIREIQIKRMLLGGHDFLASWLEFDASPYDNMYSIDLDFLNGTLTTDEFMSATEPLVRDTARRARHIFRSLMADTVALYLQGKEVEFASPGATMYGRPTMPSNVIVQEAPYIDQDSNPYAVDFVFEPLKARSVDPLVMKGLFYGMPLSHLNAGYRSLLASQKKEMQKTHYVRVLMNPTTAAIIKKGRQETEEEWLKVDAREAVSDSAFRNIIRNGGSFGRNGFVQLVWAC